MNCVEFRRTCLEQGLALGADGNDHREHCRECQRFYQKQSQFESQLAQALKIPAPEGLQSRIKLRKSFAPRWTVRHFAIAATLLLAIGGGLRLFYGPAPLDQALLAHALESHAYRTAADAPMPLAKVSQIAAGLGAQIGNAQQNGSLADVRYAGHCRIHGRLALHMLVNTDMGRYTLFLMPHHQVKERQSEQFDGHQVVIFPSGKGSVGVVVPAGSDWVETTEEQVRQAVRLAV